MKIHKICKFFGVFVWAGLSLVPMTAHAGIMVTLSCGSLSGPTGPGGTVTCPGLSSLNSVTVNESTSVSGPKPGMTPGPFPAPIPFAADVFFTPAGPSGVTWSYNGPGAPLNLITNVVPSSTTQTATAGVTIANFSSGFNVGLASDIFNGSADSITGDVSVTYDFEPVSAAVPEPSSMLLLVGGLFFLLTAKAIRKWRQRTVA
jgi:hypothetical protein